MRCILHIGTPKTGTTLIQQWLLMNRQALSRQGIYLPEMLGSHSHHVFSGYFLQGMNIWTQLMKMRSVEERDRFFDGFQERFQAEIARHAKDHDTCIITSEHLSLWFEQVPDIERISKFLDALFEDTKVVCYFRNQYDLAISAYSTHVTNGGTQDLDAFLTNVHPDTFFYNFLSIADAWTAAFGRERCSFRIHDRSAFVGGDLRKDFLRTLFRDIDSTSLDFSLETSNTGISPLLASVYRAINEAVAPYDEINGGLNSLNVLLKHQFSDITALKRGKVTSPHRERIEQIFLDSNQIFFERYFSCENRFRTPDEGAVPEDQVPISEVEDILESALGAILPMVTNGHQFLNDQDANHLIRAAAQLERLAGRAPSADALALLRMARRVRPNGPYILSRIQKLEAELVPPSQNSPDDI